MTSRRPLSTSGKLNEKAHRLENTGALRVEFTLSMEAVILIVVSAWLGTLSYVWFRHVALDDERYQRMEGRLGETVKKIEAALEKVNNYQTDFNLKVATDIADIKSDVRKLLQRP